MNKYIDSEFWLGVLSAFLAWITGFMLPIIAFIIFAGLLVGADMYTGIKAARVRKEKINSKGFYRSVEKITVYIIVLTASQGMTQVFELPFHVAWFAAFYIALAEFKSLLENAKVITGVDLWEELKDRFAGITKLKK